MLTLERAPPHAAVKRACDWRVRRAIERMETEIGSDVGLRELAADVGLSPSHLNAVFVAAVGVPPHRWLLRRRVARARELLTRTRHSITDIALSCGFSSSQHFATVFQTQEGCTPTEFRRGRSWPVCQSITHTGSHGTYDLRTSQPQGRPAKIHPP